MYSESTSTHLNHDGWLIDLDAYFHMTPHKDWFCEYERFDGGDVFLGYESTNKIVKWGRV